MSSNSPSPPETRRHPDEFWTLTPSWRTAFEAQGLDVAGVLDLSVPTEGAAPPSEHPWLSGDLEAWRRWIASGAHAGMRFMEGNAEARADARRVLASVRSAVVCLVPYSTGEKVRTGRGAVSPATTTETPPTSSTASLPGDSRLVEVVARYARGSDYHKVLRKRLEAVAASLRAAHLSLGFRAVVDSIPFFDRAHARAAGLGFVGKNTMVIRPGLGSYFFIATLLVDVPVEEYATPAPAHRLSALDCGSCTRCLDACPTGALPRPYFLDASRCLSYLTIEHRGAMPDAFLPHLTDTLYGCDICQEACPYNATTLNLVRLAELGKPRASLLQHSAYDLACAGEREYESWFGGTAMTRAKYGGLVRNALCYLYAAGDPRLAALLVARAHDPEPVIAETCARLSALVGSTGEGASNDDGSRDP